MIELFWRFALISALAFGGGQAVLPLVEHTAVQDTGWVSAQDFSSALAFTVLENAMSVVFHHRVAIHRRRFIVSALLPYFFILLLGVGLVIVTIMSGALARMATHDIVLFGLPHSLSSLSSYLLYAMGVAGEILMLTAVYLVMPVGPPSWRHALIGGVTAALLWEIARRVLVWYFTTLSQVNVVYGSMTTAIVVMFSLEIGATLLLMGAQVISDYERVGADQQAEEPKPMVTRPAK